MGLGIHESELNAQTKHCSAKHEKQDKVSNGVWQWEGCVMKYVYKKFQKHSGPARVQI